MKRYIVTGGAGFIGSNLARRLLENGAEVYIIDDLSTGFERNIPKGAVFFKADIADSGGLKGLGLPSNIDTVFHLAAQSSGEASFDDPARDIDVNYKGTYNVLKLAHAKRCKRFIYASSMSVYGDVKEGIEKVGEDHECKPASYYGCNKLASEKLIKIFVKDTAMAPTILRLFNVYGPGQNMLNMKQGMVSIYMSYLFNDKPVHVKGSLDRFRDIVYVEDVVDALTGCEDADSSRGGTFNIGTGRKTTVKELLETLLKVYKKDDFNKWVFCEGGTPGDVKGCVADINKAKNAIGWEPKCGLDEGVRRMKAWVDGTRGWWAK